MSSGAGGWTAPGSTPFPPPAPLPPGGTPAAGLPNPAHPYGGPYGGPYGTTGPGTPGGGRRPRRFMVGWVLMAAAVLTGVTLTVTTISRFIGHFGEMVEFTADETATVACTPGREWRVGPLVAGPLGSPQQPVLDDDGWVTGPAAVTVRQSDGSELQAAETGATIETITIDNRSYEATHQFTCTVDGEAVITVTPSSSDGAVQAMAAFRPFGALLTGWRTLVLGVLAGTALFVTGLVLVITGRRRR